MSPCKRRERSCVSEPADGAGVAVYVERPVMVDVVKLREAPALMRDRSEHPGLVERRFGVHRVDAVERRTERQHIADAAEMGQRREAYALRDNRAPRVTNTGVDVDPV